MDKLKTLLGEFKELLAFRLEYKQKPQSSLGIKYPTLRDHPLHTSSLWLEGKRADDGAEDLWRIHNDLYDLTNFIKAHPGGKDWLLLTKGTDITEAFECHHLSDKAEKLLPQYFIRTAKEPRNSPFTFEENGFYKSLKKKISNKLYTLPQKPKTLSKIYADALLLSYISMFVLAVNFRSYSIAAVAGICLGLTAVAAHNFFHQRDNFRMYYFDLTFMPSKEWRVSHALSHHLYPNTINDLEISAVEPWLQYLPFEKYTVIRYGSWIYSPVVYAMLFIVYFARQLISHYKYGTDFSWTVILPFSVPVLTTIITGTPLVTCSPIFLFTILVSSIYFGVVGVNAGHHHPDIFHDGDMPRYKQEMDWGVYQTDAVKDRSDINSSHFLVITNFGDHTLHHLFPTIDHGLLNFLYPVFLETCEEFGIEFKMTSQLELVLGQYRQLTKNKPKNTRPKPLKNTASNNYIRSSMEESIK